MEIALGMRVTTRDGQNIGTIDWLVVDPATNRVCAAVVRKGILLHRDIEIPLDQLTVLPSGSVQVQATAAEVDTLPHVVEAPYALPPVDDVLPAEGPISEAYWSVSALPPTPAVPATIDAEVAADLGLTGMVDPDQRAWDPTLIGHGTQVVAADGKIRGHVERLTLDPTTQQLTHVVIKHGLLGEEEEIAVGHIDRIEDGMLFLA